MNPSVASVILGKLCQKRVPDSHKKDDEMESSYQREHLLGLTTVSPNHVRRDVQVLGRFELEEVFENLSYDFSRLLVTKFLERGSTGVQMFPLR
jgi:hypothetical protein